MADFYFAKELGNLVSRYSHERSSTLRQEITIFIFVVSHCETVYSGVKWDFLDGTT